MKILLFNRMPKPNAGTVVVIVGVVVPERIVALGVEHPFVIAVVTVVVTTVVTVVPSDPVVVEVAVFAGGVFDEVNGVGFVHGITPLFSDVLLPSMNPAKKSAPCGHSYVGAMTKSPNVLIDVPIKSPNCEYHFCRA